MFSIITEDIINEELDLDTQEELINYYYEWENNMTATANIPDIGNEVLIRMGPHKNSVGLIVSEMDDNNQFKIKFDTGQVERYFESDFEVAHRCPSSIRMVKVYEGRFITVPEKDRNAMIRIASNTKNGIMVTEDWNTFREITQRWRIGANEQREKSA